MERTEVMNIGKPSGQMRRVLELDQCDRSAEAQNIFCSHQGLFPRLQRDCQVGTKLDALNFAAMQATSMFHRA